MNQIIKTSLSLCNQKRLPILDKIIELDKTIKYLEQNEFDIGYVGSINITKDNIKYHLTNDGISYTKNDGVNYHMFSINKEVEHRLFGMYHGKIYKQMAHGMIENMTEDEIFNKGYFWENTKLF